MHHIIAFVLCVQMKHIHRDRKQASNSQGLGARGWGGPFHGYSVSFGHDESPQTYTVSMVAHFVNIIH